MEFLLVWNAGLRLPGTFSCCFTDFLGGTRNWVALRAPVPVGAPGPVHGLQLVESVWIRFLIRGSLKSYPPTGKGFLEWKLRNFGAEKCPLISIYRWCTSLTMMILHSYLSLLEGTSQTTALHVEKKWFRSRFGSKLSEHGSSTTRRTGLGSMASIQDLKRNTWCFTTTRMKSRTTTMTPCVLSLWPKEWLLVPALCHCSCWTKVWFLDVFRCFWMFFGLWFL